MVNNKKPVYIVMVILAAVAIYVWAASRSPYTVGAAELEHEPAYSSGMNSMGKSLMFHPT